MTTTTMREKKKRERLKERKKYLKRREEIRVPKGFSLCICLLTIAKGILKEVCNGQTEASGRPIAHKNTSVWTVSDIFQL